VRVDRFHKDYHDMVTALLRQHPQRRSTLRFRGLQWAVYNLGSHGYSFVSENYEGTVFDSIYGKSSFE